MRARTWPVRGLWAAAALGLLSAGWLAGSAPPAAAQAPAKASEARWEYLVLEHGDIRKQAGDTTGPARQKLLNRLGQDRWELAAMAISPEGYTTLYLKRPR